MTPPFEGTKAGTMHQLTTNRAPTGHQPTTNSYINIKDNIRNIKEIYNNKRAVNTLQLLKIKY